MVVNPEDRSPRIGAQIISMRQFHFPPIDIFSSKYHLGPSIILGPRYHVDRLSMFKRYEHRGNMLLQFIPLRINKFCLFQFSPRLFGSHNAHSTLRSMDRDGFSRRSSTVGPGFITMKPKISHYAYRQRNSSRKVLQPSASLK